LEARASHLIATICGGETSCVEARDWAAFEAKDPMVRVSQDPQLLMRHITPFLRGAAFGRWPPRAVKGEVGERRWTPLRRPVGRLSGRRKTMNVSGQKIRFTKELM
jgi:hypothetical protein